MRNEHRKKDFGNNRTHPGYAAFQRETDSRYLTLVESTANFNIPKVQHCSHYVDQIRLFSSLVGYNGSINENCNIVFCKTPYRSSNTVREYVQQILQTTSRREAFNIQRLNYEAWQSRRAQMGKQAKDHKGIDSPAGSKNNASDRYYVRSSPATVPTFIPDLPLPPPADTVLGSPQHLWGENRIRTCADLLQRIPDTQKECLYDAVHCLPC